MNSISEELFFYSTALYFHDGYYTNLTVQQSLALRPESTFDVLAQLSTVYKKGTVVGNGEVESIQNSIANSIHNLT